MKTVLSGIQPSGTPHLGNYFGAIKEFITRQDTNECFYFIADLHSLTTVRDAKKMKQMTYELVATYLALGLDPEKCTLYKQSDVSAHAELTWIFDCITPMGFISRAHAFKDAEAKGKKEITVGLFNYPILMAADILLYAPDIVPVGKDQKQHVEIARDIATKFNNTFGETFKLPEPVIKKEVAVVPGTDGQKMSKSYANTVDMLADEKTLKKQIMSIVTDSKPLEEPKAPETCNVFQIYKLLATPEETKTLADKYRAGNFGYGHAKKELLQKTIDYFKEPRTKYKQLLTNTQKLDQILQQGAQKAQLKAKATMDLVKKRVGLA